MRFPLAPLAVSLLLTSAARAQTAPPQTTPTAPTYEALRASMKPVRMATAKDTLAKIGQLAGQTIEVKGVVKGIITNERGRICLLGMDDAILVLLLPPTMGQEAALRPGNLTRVLALVGYDDAQPDSALTILAATARPEPATPDNTVSVAAPGDSIYAPTQDDSIIVAPPMTDMMLPQSNQAFTPTQPSRGRNRTSSKSRPIGNDALQPAYKSLVLRHNPRLRDDQADEIAGALLSHGAAQNIDPRFLAAIIAVESGFNPRSLSPSGAMGLGQIMPFNLRSLGVSNAWDSTQNIGGTARYLRKLLDQFGNRPDGTLLAVAAYNAGPNAVVRAGYRVPQGAQVQNYVWKVYYRYKAFAPDMF